MDPYDTNLSWIESNTNLNREYIENLRDRTVSLENILVESLHSIDVAYYDRVPHGDVYVERDKKTYKSNSMGHTGPEPGQVDTLFIGCSLTSGIGLHFEQTWGYRVGEALDGSYASLGFVGGSVSKIVRGATEYIIKYGKPKRILFLAPDFMRVDGYMNTLPSGHHYHLANGNDVASSVQKTNLIYASNTKTNHRLLDGSYAYAVSAAALHQFIRLCELASINLYYGSWSTNIGFGSELYKNYVHFDFDNDSLKTLDCHAEMSHEDEFDIATDNDHHGSHYHAHVAEAFIARLKEDNAL